MTDEDALKEIMRIIDDSKDTKCSCTEVLQKIIDVITDTIYANVEEINSDEIIKMKGRVVRKYTNLPGDYGMIIKKDLGHLINHDVELLVQDLGISKRKIYKRSDIE